MDRREQASVHSLIEKTVFDGLKELTGKEVTFIED